MTNTKFTIDEDNLDHYIYLFNLRDSGICNMMEAPDRLYAKFPSTLSRGQASQIAQKWMRSCADMEKILKERGLISDKMINIMDDSDEEEEEEREQLTPPEKSYWNKTGTFQNEYERLQDKYVPLCGKADSPQGNILRLLSKFYYRCYNDGDTEFSDYAWFVAECPIPDDMLEEFHDNFSTERITSAEELEYAMDLAISYCIGMEAEDKMERPETDAAHEVRLNAALARKALYKESVARDKAVVLPIRKLVKDLDIAKIRSALSLKNQKEKKLTKRDIQTIAYGIIDHITAVNHGQGGEKVEKNPSAFGKVLEFFLSKNYIDGKFFTEYDRNQMFAMYPRSRAIITQLR